MESVHGNDEDDDIQIVKVVPKKKAVSWVASSFDGFGPNPVAIEKSFPTPKTTTHNKVNQPGRKESGGIQSSITDFTSELQPRKRMRESVHRLSSRVQAQTHLSLKAALNTTELWSEKYRPKSRADLAVHKKKVDEIAEWLKHQSQHISKHAAPILLLTGPPGAGKSVCIQVLCTELGLDIQEWSSNSESAAEQWSSNDFKSGEKSRVDVYMSQSQSSLFHNFLLRSTKYRALELIGAPARHSSTASGLPINHDNGTVIVVEDMPNIFYRETSQFHDILRKYAYTGHCPLVFIMSESNSNSSSLQKLFPKDLQQKLNITNISMNPVAPTVLVKLLNRVMSKEAAQSKFTLSNASVVETVAMSSSGDVRSALNTLQFTCRQDTENISALYKTTSKSVMKKRGSGAKLKYSVGRKPNKDEDESDTSSSLLGAKDKAVFLFHAIGKILYFKRGDPREYRHHPSLPDHLKVHQRDPLLLDPEEIAHQSHLPGDYFISFLHENYVDFMPCVEDLERATQYFSDSDYFSTLWVVREELQNYSVSVATRGVIHSNSECIQHDSSRKSQGWWPLHKSQWFNVSKKAIENILAARQLFKGCHWEPEVLCTEILPFISLTNPTLHDTGQITFVQEITQFPHRKEVIRSRLERLEDKDVVADDVIEIESMQASRDFQVKDASISNSDSFKLDPEDDEDTFVASSQTSVQNREAEEEFVIEDFDDDEI